MVRNPNGSVGLFLIPMVLVLIGLAQLVRGMPPFRPESTIGMWRAIHGISLLLGTMFICFGLTFGAMYLVQSHRLKHKKRPSQRIKLPTLEFLQSMNRLSLFASALGLAVGAISGIVLSFNREGHIDWFSGGIVFTFALFVWLFVAAIMELTATGSLGGRRSAYLVIANFLFLVVVLGLVLVSSHGRQAKLENSVRELDEYLHNRLQNGLVAIAHEAVTNDLPRAEARL
jgi:magnesium-transporting ATPase (P-type)